MSEPLNDDLRLVILRLARRMRLERVDGDITDGQISVLSVLDKHGSQTLGSLSDHERVSPPSMNRTVNHLVEAGLVSRTTSPDDGRKVHIALTEKGEHLVSETRARRIAWFGKRLSGLTPEQRELLDAAAPVLQQIADS